MRVAIINDSAIATEAQKRVLRTDPALEIAWIARDGAEGVAKAARERPELILMDLIMPNLDGVEATRRIMAECPCPILVVTATVTGNINMVYEAMGHGALDAVNTPTIGAAGVAAGGEALLTKIRQIGALTSPRSLTAELRAAAAAAEERERRARATSTQPSKPPTIPLVVVGASTGGPRALAEILGRLPNDWPAAMVVAQHIDEGFAPGLVRWLAGSSILPVTTSRPGLRPERGQVTISATNDHLVLRTDGRLDHVAEPRFAAFRPSVDVFFSSVADVGAAPGVAIVLTGMGKDGARGLKRLKDLSWRTIAQDQATSAVWGMPKTAFETGAAAQLLPPSAMADQLNQWARQAATSAG